MSIRRSFLPVSCLVGLLIGEAFGGAFLGSAAIAQVSATEIVAEPNVGQKGLQDLVKQATDSDRQVAERAIANLREYKDAGVTAFWQTYRRELSQNPDLRATLDAICQQKDCDASRLYWYRDLEAAKLMAKQTGKPILSLRLLGNLSDELSCANSRFFRTALYPNATVSQLLRDRFILHWQSERPVPKVTIDFGDGRKLEQTLTGNSIHYVLDANGRPIDAIPGLYSPQAFVANLKNAETVAQSLRNISETGSRRKILTDYHRDRFAKLEQNWQSDLTKLQLPSQPLLSVTATMPRASAMLASRLTVGKAMTELPTLRRTAIEPTGLDSQPSPFAKLSDRDWTRLARLYQNRVYLDQGSLSVMQRKLSANAEMPTVVRSFERAIAEDTVRNEYVFHAQIHDWLANDAFADSADALIALNRRVYDQLFLTPASDPWLGLVNDNIYTGISKN